MAKETVRDVVTALCGALSDLGCVYDCDFDNRGGQNKSCYVFVRKPLPAKLRVSDHRSSRIDKDKGRAKMLIIDIGVGARVKNAITWQEAITQIAAMKTGPQHT